MTKEQLQERIFILKNLISDNQKQLNKLEETVKLYDEKLNLIPEFILSFPQDKISLEKKFELTEKIYAFAFMLKLADLCNSKFESQEGSWYVLCYHSNLSYINRIEINDTCVRFNSIYSVEFAIEQIGSNPEYTRIAKIFLGVSE